MRQDGVCYVRQSTHLELLQEGVPEEGWRKFLDMAKDPAWILESAFRLATKNNTKSDYVALRKIFTGASPFSHKHAYCIYYCVSSICRRAARAWRVSLALPSS